MSVKQQAPERALAVYPDAAERARRLTSEGPLVVKVGGSIQDVPAQMAQVMGDAAALAAMGVAVVVVHGGGKAISAAMGRARGFVRARVIACLCAHVRDRQISTQRPGGEREKGTVRVSDRVRARERASERETAAPPAGP